MNNLELINDLYIGISYVDERVVVVFLEVAKSQTGWRTKYDKWKFKEHVFK